MPIGFGTFTKFLLAGANGALAFTAMSALLAYNHHERADKFWAQMNDSQTVDESKISLSPLTEFVTPTKGPIMATQVSACDPQRTPVPFVPVRGLEMPQGRDGEYEVLCGYGSGAEVKQAPVPEVLKNAQTLDETSK